MTPYRPKVYGASKINLWENWLRWAEVFPAVEFVNRWPSVIQARNGVDCKDSNESASRCWLVDFQDIQRADALILVTPQMNSQHLRGALIEAGYALALGKPVHTVGQHPDLGTWCNHPMVRQHLYMAEAVAAIAGIYE